MTRNSNLVIEMAQEAHDLIGGVCRTLKAVEGAIDYVESMTGSAYGKEEVARARSYANLARLEIGQQKQTITNGEYEVYTYDDEAMVKRYSAYVTMLKTVYGDSLEEMTGVNVDGVKNPHDENAHTLVALAKETGVSLDWLMGGVA